jgi:hypothetical protein
VEKDNANCKLIMMYVCIDILPLKQMGVIINERYRGATELTSP